MRIVVTRFFAMCVLAILTRFPFALLAVVTILLAGGPAFATCDCTNFTPGLQLRVTSGVGSGSCGKVDGIRDLACSGLYGSPAYSYYGTVFNSSTTPEFRLPDQITSVTRTNICTPAGLTLGATTFAEAGRSCTSPGCSFGPPIPLPSMGLCVTPHFVADASGTADCSTGSPATLNYPLSLYVGDYRDILPFRCNGGPTPGKGCTDQNVTGGQCGAGGTCVNDFGRCAWGPQQGQACTDSGSGFLDIPNCGADAGECQNHVCQHLQTDNYFHTCLSDADCWAQCYPGHCVGGSAPGKGCRDDVPNSYAPDWTCPGVGAHCETLTQPCPICNPTTHVCNGGPNAGQPCTPAGTATGGALPTSLDCPLGNPVSSNQWEVPLPLILGTTTETITAINLPSQTSPAFCGFCGEPGSFSAAFAYPPVPCTSAGDCVPTPGFPVCREGFGGSFGGVHPLDATQTISVTGISPGNLTDGQAHMGRLADVLCIPPTPYGETNAIMFLPSVAAFTFPASFNLACPASCDDGNPCTLDICDPIAGGCTHPPNPNGAQLCNDNLPCTADSCNVATGQCEHAPITDPAGTTSCSDGQPCNGTERCVTSICQPGTPISGCDPACSAEGIIGPTGGSVSTPNVTVQFPPNAVTSSTPVSILCLSQSPFKLGNAARAVYTVDLQPAGQTFSVPVKIAMKWANAADGCAVAGISPILRENLLQVFRNGTPITTDCGGGTTCPLTAIHGACMPATVCTAATCDARTNTFPNTYEVDVTSFSEYAMATPCEQAGSTKLKVSGLTTGPGDDRLRFTGELDLVGTTLEALDLLQNGAGLVLQGSAAPIGGVSLPGGAYDTAAKAGWKVNNARTRWRYSNRSAPPNGIFKATFVSTAPGHVKFEFKGKGGFYPATTDTTALVVLPDGGDCFAMSPAPTCTLSASGRTLACQ